MALKRGQSFCWLTRPHDCIPMYSDTADVPPPYTKPPPTSVPGNVSTVSATVVTQPVIVHQVCVYMCMHACVMITCHFSHVLYPLHLGTLVHVQ